MSVLHTKMCHISPFSTLSNMHWESDTIIALVAWVTDGKLTTTLTASFLHLNTWDCQPTGPIILDNGLTLILAEKNKASVLRDAQNRPHFHLSVNPLYNPLHSLPCVMMTCCKYFSSTTISHFCPLSTCLTEVTCLMVSYDYFLSTLINVMHLI